jgi:hypothetical protein
MINANIVACVLLGIMRRLAITKSDDSRKLFRPEYGTRTPVLTGAITEYSNCQSISHKAGYKTKSTDEIYPDERSKFVVGTPAVDEDGKPFLAYTVKHFPVKDLKITQRLSAPSRDTQYKDSPHLSLTQVRCDFEHVSDVLNGSVPQRLRKEFPQELFDKSKEKVEDSLVAIPSRTWVKEDEEAESSFNTDKGEFTKKGTVLRSRYSSNFAVRAKHLQNILHPKQSEPVRLDSRDFGTVHDSKGEPPDIVKVATLPIPDRVWPKKFSGPASKCMAGPDVYRLGSEPIGKPDLSLLEWLQEVRKKGPLQLAGENAVDTTLYAASGYSQHAGVWDKTYTQKWREGGVNPLPRTERTKKIEPLSKFKKYLTVDAAEVGPREAYLRISVEPEYKSWTDAEWEALTPDQRKDAMAELSGFVDLHTKTPELWASRYGYGHDESQPRNYIIVAWKPRASPQRHTGRTTKYSPECHKRHDEQFLANSLCGLMNSLYNWTNITEYLHISNVAEVVGKAKGLSCAIPVRKVWPASRDGIVCRVWTPLVREVKDYCIASVSDKYSKLEHHKRTRKQEDECVRLNTLGKDGKFGYFTWSKDDVLPYITNSTHHYEARIENFLAAMHRCKPKLLYVTKKKTWVARCGKCEVTLSDNGRIRSSKHWKDGTTVEERGKPLDWIEALTHCQLSIRHGDPAKRDFWEGYAAICRKAGGTTAPGFVLDQPKKGDVLKQPREKLVQMQEGYTSELDSALWGEGAVWEAEEWEQKAYETGTSSKDIFNVEEPEEEDESDASE